MGTRQKKVSLTVASHELSGESILGGKLFCAYGLGSTGLLDCFFYLGIVCIELALRWRRQFFQAPNHRDLYASLSNNHNLPVEQLPDGCSPILRQLVTRCCAYSSRDRPKIEEVIQFLRCVVILITNLACCVGTMRPGRNPVATVSLTCLCKILNRELNVAVLQGIEERHPHHGIFPWNLLR